MGRISSSEVGQGGVTFSEVRETGDRTGVAAENSGDGDLEKWSGEAENGETNRDKTIGRVRGSTLGQLWTCKSGDGVRSHEHWSCVASHVDRVTRLPVTCRFLVTARI